jgi:hypothetical protein
MFKLTKKMKKFLFLKNIFGLQVILFFYLSISLSSCNKDNTTSPYFVEFTLGSRTYKAEKCYIYCDFDMNNFYNGSSDELFFVSSGKGIINPNVDTDILFVISFDRSTKKEVNYIMIFEEFQQASIRTGSVYSPCPGQPNFTTINLNITRNDNTIGGIVEGNFSGKGWNNWDRDVDSGYDPPYTCKTGVYNINGKFRLKIQ